VRSAFWVVRSGYKNRPFLNTKESILSAHPRGYTPEQAERLEKIHARLVEARRELDALIGDAYLRPRASIVPVHFLDLASAVEKLRWAEKEWRELEKEVAPETEEAELRFEESPSGSGELVEAQSR
jgi:hypothetical protein